MESKITSLVKKLGIKPGYTMLILHAPKGYLATLDGLPNDVTVVVDKLTAANTADFVQLFVRSAAEIRQYAPNALKALKKGGLLWVCYPKKTAALKSDLSREITWEAMAASTGWRPVTQVAIDDTWSALRFRPHEEVKKRGS